MKNLLIYLFLAISPLGFTQILDNAEGKTFGDVPFFNEEFIQRNHVKTISGYYSTKAKMSYIQKTKDIYYYEFNENGQLVKDYRTQYGDTLISMYSYDSLSRLSILRKSDNVGFHSYHFTYDNKGRVLAEEYRRDVNKVGNKAKFQLDKSYIVSIERYAYVDLEGANYKKIYFNNADRIYKEEFFYFNEDGYLLKEEGRLKMGSGLTNTSYTYDEMGRVIQKTVEKRVMGNYTSKWKYEYDEHSNVLAQHYYKNEVYMEEIQIVYIPETLLLKAFIYLDTETSFMTILQFSNYTFFE